MKPYNIGYTTGVFDLFHVGHLNILKRAKNYCEHLIVGVSTDELVKIYKSKFPVIPFDERVKIVQAIKYVDKVVVQKSMDKLDAWKEYKFDVMFHGDDWKDNLLFQEIEKKLNLVGADVVYFPYTEGVSSTLIKEKSKVEVRL